MDQTLYYNSDYYTYKGTIVYSGISLRLYETGTYQIVEKSEIMETTAHKDLQGFHTFYEYDVTNDAIHSIIQNVFIRDSLHPIVKVIDVNKFLIQGPSQKAGFTKQIKHILYSLSERGRQIEKNEYTIHAAAVGLPENTSILILGDKGNGKTITSYALCQTHGLTLVGNDLVILGRNKTNALYLHGGTTNITMRKSIVNSLFPELSKEIILNTEFLNLSDYEDKITFNAQDIGIKTSDLALPLRLVVRVNIHPSATGNFVNEQFSKNIEALRLHENLARHIRGQTTPVCLEDNGHISGFYESLDSIEAQKSRNSTIDYIFKVPFIYLTARTPHDAANLITNSLQI